jgi:hypothetical protein
MQRVRAASEFNAVKQLLKLGLSDYEVARRLAIPGPRSSIGEDAHHRPASPAGSPSFIGPKR